MITIVSPLPHRRGRLEIIPLIDIMFFLLAAFMLVSINKIHVKSLKVNLPTNVPTAQIEKKEDFVSVSVNADGQVQIDKELITDKNQVLPKLQALYAQKQDQKFLISADKEARNGDVVLVLGQLRAAGFQKVAFSISSVPVVGASAAGAVAPPASALSVPAPTLTPPPDAPSAASSNP
jgi:biopolymer transport protein ExbD